MSLRWRSDRAELWRYIGWRLVQLTIVLIGVSAVVFFTMHVLPGDVAMLLLGDRGTAEQLAKLRLQLGLDQPIIVQYLRFVVAAAHGDFGTSLTSNRAAFTDVSTAFPVTLQLTLAALALATFVGVPAGVLASLKPGRTFDNLAMTFTLFGVSMPIFWLGLMLLLLFGATLDWLPIGGLSEVGMEPPRITGMSLIDAALAGSPSMFWDALRHLILPACTLATVPLAFIARITRAEMMATATQDHVRTARAKGLPRARVILRHVLRNALIPIVTVIGLQLGLLLSGAVLTETIFSLPGLGRLMVEFDPLARLSRGAGGRALHRFRLRAGESPRRSLLHAARSADTPRVTIAAPHPSLGAASERWYAPVARVLRRHEAKLGLAIVLAFLFLTVAAPLLSPYDPYDQELASALAPPSAQHLFGADQYGRDVFSRVLYGSRTALLAIVVADGLALVLGSALGLVGGFLGGAVDALVMRVVDVLLAFPYLLLALIIVAALGPSLTNSMIAIGIVYTPQYARLIRGQVLAVRALDYVRAARAIGTPRWRIMLRHVLPNSFGPVIVMATLQAGSVVVETAGLSFLGLGAQPPSPDWGALLADGHNYFLTAWWIATFPGLAIFCVVLGFNLIGDALRDQFDPRRRT